MKQRRKAKTQTNIMPCPQGKIERFIEPCLLLLLAEKSPAHGYELMEHLDQFDFDPRCMDPGQIYRALRRMDKDGLVESSWETSEAGPAKRCYHVTAEGEEFLGAWMETLTKRVRIIGNLLTRYEEIIERKGS